MKSQIVLLVFSFLTLAFTTNVVDTLKVDLDQSSVSWVGKKVTGQHSGTIGIKEGTLSVKNGKLTGGGFVIDMTSLKVTDLEGGMADKLAGHLASDDFFSIATHPTSALNITDVKDTGDGMFDVTADLTIKGITHPVMFSTLLTSNAAGASATAKIIIDRTKYDVKYGSGKFFDALGDKMIYDDFELNVTIVATK